MDAESLYTGAQMFKQKALDFLPFIGKLSLASALTVAVYLAGPGASAKQDLAAATQKQPCTMGEQQIGKKSYVTSTMIVNARPEVCYKICTDYKNAATTFPTLKKCLVIQDKGSGNKVIKYVTRPTGAFTDYSYTLEVKETPMQMVEWNRIDGDFKAIDGYWKIEPAQGSKTLVTYVGYVDGGLFMPQVLIKRQFRIDLPPCMTALKAKAESMNKPRVADKPDGAVDQ
jgi:ribosome-associated toxin RatA of RatAB toxin-antitoxin module